MAIKKPKYKIEVKGQWILISLGRNTMEQAVRDLKTVANVHYTREPFACVKFSNEIYKEIQQINDEGAGLFETD